MGVKVGVGVGFGLKIGVGEGVGDGDGLKVGVGEGKGRTGEGVKVGVKNWTTSVLERITQERFQSMNTPAQAIMRSISKMIKKASTYSRFLILVVPI